MAVVELIMRPALRQRSIIVVLALVVLLTTSMVTRPSQAQPSLPALIFVARGHLATRDFIFTNDLGPAGQLTTGLNKFAPGSKLVVREADGRLRVLLDTSLPPGDPLNPLGLRDLQSPDVSFDAARIVFAGTTGPRMFKDRSYARPRYSWRIY